MHAQAHTYTDATGAHAGAPRGTGRAPPPVPARRPAGRTGTPCRGAPGIPGGAGSRHRVVNGDALRAPEGDGWAAPDRRVPSPKRLVLPLTAPRPGTPCVPRRAPTAGVRVFRSGAGARSPPQCPPLGAPQAPPRVPPPPCTAPRGETLRRFLRGRRDGGAAASGGGGGGVINPRPPYGPVRCPLVFRGAGRRARSYHFRASRLRQVWLVYVYHIFAGAKGGWSGKWGLTMMSIPRRFWRCVPSVLVNDRQSLLGVGRLFTYLGTIMSEDGDGPFSSNYLSRLFWN